MLLLGLRDKTWAPRSGVQCTIQLPLTRPSRLLCEKMTQGLMGRRQRNLPITLRVLKFSHKRQQGMSHIRCY